MFSFLYHFQDFSLGLCCSSFLVCRVVLLCVHVFTFWVPCCNVNCDFRTKTMFGSSSSLVVCERARLLLALFVFVACGDVQHILSGVFVLFSSSCCQFLWIVKFGLPLRYSLMFISYRYSYFMVLATRNIFSSFRRITDLQWTITTCYKEHFHILSKNNWSSVDNGYLLQGTFSHPFEE